MGIVQRQGIRNSIITYIGIAIGAVSLIIIQPRFLSKEEIGLTRLLFSFSTILGNLMSLGVTATVVRYFPYFRDKDKNHHGFFGFILIFPVVGYLFFGALLYLFKGYILARYAGNSKLFTDYFYYLFPLSFFLTITSVLTSYSYAQFRTSVPALINDVLLRIVSIVLFTIYFIKWIDRDQFIMLFIGIYGLQFLAMVLYIYSIDKPSLKVKWDQYREHTPRTMFIYGIILSLGGLAALGLRYLDVMVLGTYQPKQASLNALDVVGIYAIAAFIGTFIEAPIGALDKILVPKMADGWKRNDIDDIRQMYYKSARYLFLIGGVLFLLINLNIDSLFKLIPDHDYSLAKGVVFIISLGTLINMCTGSNDAILYTSIKYRIMIWLLLGLVVVAYINYKIFIPLFGMEGAAIATALSAFLYNLVKFLLIWKYFHMQPFTWDTPKVIIVILLTGGAVYFVPVVNNPFVSIALRSSLIGIIFSSLVYLFRIVPEYDYLIPFLKERK